MGSKLETDYLEIIDEFKKIDTRVSNFKEEVRNIISAYNKKIEGVADKDKNDISAFDFKQMTDKIFHSFDEIQSNTIKFQSMEVNNPLLKLEQVAQTYSNIFQDAILNPTSEFGQSYAISLELNAGITLDLDKYAALVSTGLDVTAVVHDYLLENGFSSAVTTKMSETIMNTSVKTNFLNALKGTTSVSAVVMTLQGVISGWTNLEEHKYDGNYSEALVETLVDWTGIGLGTVAGGMTEVALTSFATSYIFTASVSGPPGWAVLGISLAAAGVGWGVAEGISALSGPIKDGIDWLEDEVGGWFELNLGW
ncbi:TPA_asm: hypothetical protein GYZ54_15155 [Listeria monocytogenes]|nr:hypothetical protein [Listeria monocytogenes]